MDSCGFSQPLFRSLRRVSVMMLVRARSTPWGRRTMCARGAASTGGAERTVGRNGDLRAFLEAVGAVDHDALARLQAGGDAGAFTVDRAGLDLAHRHRIVGLHDIDELAHRTVQHSRS